MSELPELRRLLSEVGAAPPPPSDLGAAVRQSTPVRRRGTALALLALAVLVAAGVYALDKGVGTGDSSLTTAGPSPTSSASQRPSPTPSPVPAPVFPTPDQATATVTASAPSVTARPTPRPTPAATRPPTQAPRSPTPAPVSTYAPPGAHVTFTWTQGSGHDVTFTVTVRDTDGYLLGGTMDFGDHSQTTLNAANPTCGRRSGYTPEPTTHTQTLTHSYPGQGIADVFVTVTTGSTCRATPRETAQVEGKVSAP